MTKSHGRNVVDPEPPMPCSKLAFEKAKIVEPLRGLRVIPSDKMIEACRAAGKLLNKPEGEVSHQTIRNWLEMLETKGIASLDRKARKDRGKTEISPRLERIIKGILLHPKRFSIAETYRRVERYALHFLKLPPEQVPSRKQVYFIWEHIPNEDKVLAFEGIVAYRRLFDQHVRFEAAHANAIWQGDHHQLDIIVIDPETGEELGRPWLTKIQDDRSRAIMGYYLSLKHPGSMGIALALYHAFLSKPQEWWLMHGLPKILYVDNGKDWISHHIEAVCLHFDIQLLPHEPYHPQSKGKIENWFKTLEEMCIHPLDGSVGSNPKKRPQRITPKLTLEQVRVKIVRHIREFHERRHGTTKQRPLDRWLEDRTVVRTVTKLEDIDHLLKSKPYTVHRDGIHFQYGHYRDPDQVLAGHIGQVVTVFFNPDDKSRIRIWNKNEADTYRYLCTAYPQPVSELPPDRDAISEENKRRRELIRQRVRAAQKEGQEVLKLLEVDEAQRDADAQQETTVTEELPVTPPPAAGLLETRRSTSSPASQPVAANATEGSTDMDARRRQLIRAKRSQQ
jgi:putative transposase